MLTRLTDHYFKMKVGSADPEEDVMRARAIRETIGPDNVLMMDANQKWDVNVRVPRFPQLCCHETPALMLANSAQAHSAVGALTGGDREHDEACRVQADVDRRANKL